MDVSTSRHALAGLCAVSQSFSHLPEMAQLAGGDDALRQTVAFARRLSAGSAAPPAEPGRPLRSIFANLQADGVKGDANRYWPALPLEMREEALVPQPFGELFTSRLAALSSDFDKAARPLLAALAQAPDNGPLLESLLMLMQRFLVGVPAADAGDTSLYDHARMTGALAAVLAGNDAAASEQHDRPIALLAGGDLSGIQDFIYTITSRGAAGALRGRSFYLQLLTDAVMRYALRELQLPMTNVVYAGGGKFYLLARAGDAEKIAAVQRHTSDVLLRHHRGDLYLSLQTVPLTASDFKDGQISAAWGRLSELHQAAKQRRFAELEVAAFATLFEPAGDGGNEAKECQVCGAEDESTQIYDASDTSPEGVRKCEQCKSFEAWGDDLRRAKVMTFEMAQPRPSSRARGAVDDILFEFGLKVRLFFDGKGIAMPKAPGVVFALSDSAVMPADAGLNVATGRRYLTNVTPSVEQADIALAKKAELKDVPALNEVKPFDLMALQSKGIERLGVLMMDVDGLGAIFRQGLGARATLPRLAHLSFAINLFFEGYVAEIARTLDVGEADLKYRGRLYSIYAGGDDLFFAGAWDAVIALAQKVRAALDRYTGGHAGVHASGAIVLIGGKYPLYRAAQDLKAAQQQAKDLTWKLDGVLRRKDALCFLGQALPWSRVGYGDAKADGDTAAGVKDLLLNLQSEGDKSLIRKLAALYEQYAEANEPRVKEGLARQLFGPWHYRAAYVFARAGKNAQPAAASILKDDFKGIEWVGLGARWADLASRNRE